MKVLQVFYKLPYPPNDGGAYSLLNSALCLLKNDVDLNILSMKLLKNKDDELMIPSTFIETTNFLYVEIDNNIKWFDAFLNLFHKDSYFSRRFYSKEFESSLIRLINENSYDIIQLEHSYLTIYLSSIRNNFSGKVLLRAQNVEHKLWESFLISKSLFSPLYFYLRLMTKRLRTLEISALNVIDGLICLSNEDRLVFDKINPNLPKCVIPVGFNEDLLDRINVSENTFCIYHIGSMDWFPNIEGINWFLEKVMPKLLNIKSDFIVRLAGKKLSPDFKNPFINNVIIDGEVPDSIHYQSDKPIMIVPLLSGGGIRVKIIEAMALGKVIVSTSKGAEGILCTHGENILIANSPDEFANSLVQCLESTELRNRLSFNAKKLYNSHYRLSEVGIKTIKFYESLF